MKVIDVNYSTDQQPPNETKFDAITKTFRCQFVETWLAGWMIGLPIVYLPFNYDIYHYWKK